MNKLRICGGVCFVVGVAFFSSIATAAAPPAKAKEQGKAKAEEKPKGEELPAGEYRLKLAKGATWKTDYEVTASMKQFDPIRNEDKMVMDSKSGWRGKFVVQEADDQGNCKLGCTIEQVLYTAPDPTGRTQFDLAKEAKTWPKGQQLLQFFREYPTTYTYASGKFSSGASNPAIVKLANNLFKDPFEKPTRNAVEAVGKVSSAAPKALRIPSPPTADTKRYSGDGYDLIHEQPIRVTYEVLSSTNGKLQVKSTQDFVNGSTPMNVTAYYAINEKTGWVEEAEIVSKTRDDAPAVGDKPRQEGQLTFKVTPVVEEN